MAMLRNPYVAGNPLKEQAQFIGREDIVREVMQMLRHPDEKAIVLYGQRRIGKTSILMHLVQRLDEECQFSPVFFDLMDRATASLGEVTYNLAQGVAARLKLPPPDPKRFDADGLYFRQEYLPQAAAQASPEGLVILFDEFDVLDSPQKGQAGQVFFPYLRSCLAELKQVKFVFVIGRRPEELSTDTLSTFKGIRAARVSALSRAACEQVIRQSEPDHGLVWSAEAVERVWDWTQGHAYFTQLLCSVVWENLLERTAHGETATALPDDVERAVPDALKHGANAFAWIWDGLPPAERVVIAAMAEAPVESIHAEDIEEILKRSGVRMIVRELKIAPDTLVEWEVLRPADGSYRFSVPLLRQWVRNNRPLSRVKEEMDRLDPAAEALFRAGQSYYSLGKRDAAAQQLREALNINEHHLKAGLLLGRILLEQNTPQSVEEAVKVLNAAYQFDSSAALPDLMKALLTRAEMNDTDDQRLDAYDRILEIQPDQPAALEKRAAIWRARGDMALSKGDFSYARESYGKISDAAGLDKVRMAEQQYWFTNGEQALRRGEFVKAKEAYEKAGDQARVAMVVASQRQSWIDQGEKALLNNDLGTAEEFFKLAENQERLAAVTQMREKRWTADQLKQARQDEENENWDLAVRRYQSILERYPNNIDAQERLKQVQGESVLIQNYQKAMDLLKTGDNKEAMRVFAQVIAIRPDYKSAARFLYRLVEKERQGNNPVGSLLLWQTIMEALRALAIAVAVYILVKLLLVPFAQMARIDIAASYTDLAVLAAVAIYLGRRMIEQIGQPPIQRKRSGALAPGRQPDVTAEPSAKAVAEPKARTAGVFAGWHSLKAWQWIILAVVAVLAIPATIILAQSFFQSTSNPLLWIGFALCAVIFGLQPPYYLAYFLGWLGSAGNPGAPRSTALPALLKALGTTALSAALIFLLFLLIALFRIAYQSDSIPTYFIPACLFGVLLFLWIFRAWQSRGPSGAAAIVDPPVWTENRLPGLVLTAIILATVALLISNLAIHISSSGDRILANALSTSSSLIGLLAAFWAETFWVRTTGKKFVPALLVTVLKTTGMAGLAYIIFLIARQLLVSIGMADPYRMPLNITISTLLGVLATFPVDRIFHRMTAEEADRAAGTSLILYLSANGWIALAIAVYGVSAFFLSRSIMASNSPANIASWFYWLKAMLVTCLLTLALLFIVSRFRVMNNRPTENIPYKQILLVLLAASVGFALICSPVVIVFFSSYSFPSENWIAALAGVGGALAAALIVIKIGLSTGAWGGREQPGNRESPGRQG